MSRRTIGLIALVAGYLILGLGYSLVVPLGESPDEVDHVRYVQFIAQTGRLPVMQPVAADNDTMEANQPPLYYLLGRLGWGRPENAETGLVEFAFAPCFPPDPADPGRKQFYLHKVGEQFPYSGTDAAFWRVRLASLLMGAGTVLLTFALGRQLAPGDDRPAFLAAALVAFNPQFLFITASVNNDNLTALLGAAIVLVSALVARELRPGRVILLGVLLGLSALTKLALLALWPVALLAVCWAAYRSAGDCPARLRRAIAPLAALVFIPTLLAGWWYIRAQRLYGDPLAWDVHLQAKGGSVLRTGPFNLADLGDFLVQHFQSYWATFGWLNIQPPPIIYWLLLALLATALLGLLLILRDKLANGDRRPGTGEWRPGTGEWGPGTGDRRPGNGDRRPETGDRRPGTAEQGPPSAVRRLPSAVYLLSIFFVYLSLLRYIQTINFSGYQGRLAYAVAGPVAALLALGLWRVGGRALAWISGVGMALLAVACLFFVLLPAYPRPDIYQPANVSERMCARFDGWQLEAVTLPEQVAPGAALPVTLHGYGLAANASPAAITLDIVGQNGTVEGELTSMVNPSGREPFMVTFSLPIAETAQTGPALLRIRPDDPMQLTNARGQLLETYLPLTIVNIQR